MTTFRFRHILPVSSTIHTEVSYRDVHAARIHRDDPVVKMGEAAAGRAQEDETILTSGVSSQGILRFVHRIRQADRVLEDCRNQFGERIRQPS